jgi:hypothetical protein
MTITDLKDWAPVVSAGIALLSLLAVTWMAWLNLQVAKRQALVSKRQAELAKCKLRYDLFERRVDVYDEVRAIVNSTIEHDFTNPTLESEFRNAIKDVRWLFGEEMHVYLETDVLGRLMAYHRELEAQMPAQRTGCERIAEFTNENFIKTHAALKDANSQLPRKFTRFLRVVLADEKKKKS